LVGGDTPSKIGHRINIRMHKLSFMCVIQQDSYSMTAPKVSKL